MPGYGEGGYGEGVYGGGITDVPDAWIPATQTGQDALKWVSADTTGSGATPVYSNTIVIPAQTTTSVLYDFPVRVKLSDLTAGWKAGLVDRGSGTLRVRDQSGADVPFDLVWVDESTGTGDLFFKAPKINRLLNTYFTVDLVLAATPPAATDPLGRNAVWADYDAVFLDGLTVNRTGNGNNLLTSGLSASGHWFSASGSSVGTSTVSLHGEWTVGVTFRSDTNVGQAGLVSYTSSGTYSTANRSELVLHSGTVPAVWNSTDGFLDAPSPTYTYGSTERLNITKSSSTLRSLYRNGSVANSFPSSPRPGGAGDKFVVAASELNSVVTGVAGAIGDSDTAARTDGTNYITFPQTGLPSGSAPFSLEIWAKPTIVNTSQGLISIGTFGTNGRANALRLAGTNAAPQIVHYWWGNDLTVNAPGITVGAWCHIVVTWDGVTRTIYFNGSSLGSNTPAVPNVVIGTPTIGQTYTGEIFNGDLDEAAIYNYALSPAQISAHYLAAAGATYASTILADNPLNYYRLGDAAGSLICTDSSGHGNNGVYGVVTEPFTGSLNRIYLRSGVLTDSWISAEETSWEDTIGFYYVTETAPPVVTSFDHVWWDGSAYQPAILRGWWDGTSIQPVSVLGVWDGTTIQPILPAS